MSPPRLEGKVAIITGAAGGIGAAAARRFAARGCALLLSDADGERARATRGGARRRRERRYATTSPASRVGGRGRAGARGPRAHRRPAQQRRRVPRGAAAETSLEDFRRVIDVNVVGVFLGMRTVAPAMSEQRAGSIINVSSVAGLTGAPLLSAYAASKWAVRGMSKVVARELAQFGVRVNSLHPGQIDTDMNARQREATPELIEQADQGDPAEADRHAGGGRRRGRLPRLRRERLHDGLRARHRRRRHRLTVTTRPLGGAQMSPINHQVRLAARPVRPAEGPTGNIIEEPVPTPGAGEFVVDVSHISLDPAMRGWMNAGASYIEPVEVGAVMRAGAVGRVIASEHPGFAVGEHVYSDFGVQEHALSDGTGVLKIDPALAPLPTYLGTLG